MACIMTAAVSFTAVFPPHFCALASKKRFPGLLAMFARMGEQTGQLPQMLERAARLAKVQLEMGGKNPLVVLDDADLKTAVECAVNGAFFLPTYGTVLAAVAFDQTGWYDADPLFPWSVAAAAICWMAPAAASVALLVDLPDEARARLLGSARARGRSGVTMPTRIATGSSR